MSQLDQYLLKTLLYLFDNWFNPNTGIVACCIYDEDKVSFATSTRNGLNWLHAERNAYEKFVASYNCKPSSNATFIITLSPCVKDLKYRGESSCSELIQDLGVKRIHFGVLDDFHVPTLDEYTQLGFTATVTTEPHLAEMCQKLMSMFATYESRINSELLEIKIELSLEFFQPVWNVISERNVISRENSENFSLPILKTITPTKNTNQNKISHNCNL